MAQYFNVSDLTSDDHYYESIKYVGGDCKSSICFCGISQAASALISTIVEDLNPIGYFVITLHDILNPVDYSNGNEPNLIFIRSFRNEVYKNGDITFIKFAESSVMEQQQTAKAIFETVSPKTIFVLDSKKKRTFSDNCYENSVYTLSNREKGSIENSLSSPNQICGLSAGILIYSIPFEKEIECIIEYLCEPDDSLVSFSFTDWTRLILSKIDEDQVNNLAIWKKFNFDDVLNHSMHNLIILQGGILAVTK